MIVWRKDECGFTVSDCGRFKIEPKYWGCVSPTSYELKVDGKHEATATLLRDAKTSAQAFIEMGANSTTKLTSDQIDALF